VVLLAYFVNYIQCKIPVMVMLPLDTVTSSLTLNNPDKLQSYLLS
jgi:hypothetical protein